MLDPKSSLPVQPRSRSRPLFCTNTDGTDARITLRGLLLRSFSIENLFNDECSWRPYRGEGKCRSRSTEATQQDLIKDVATTYGHVKSEG